jgi:hypothetical protein
MIKGGHQVVVYEKSSELGGVWTLGYPDVRLQNTGYQYRLSDIPWTNPPDRHPTSGQIRKYLNEAAKTLGLEIMLAHEVISLEEIAKGWRLSYRNDCGGGGNNFDFVIASIGQYTEGKNVPTLPGQQDFGGEIITERDVHDLDVFDGKKVLVAGFGKSALDMATFAVERASEVHHVFRTPRWMIPFRMLGIHYSHLMFCRMGTVMMPSWAQPNRFEAFIHRRLTFLVRGSWGFITTIVRTQNFLRGRGDGAGNVPEVRCRGKASALSCRDRRLCRRRCTPEKRRENKLRPGRVESRFRVAAVSLYAGEIQAIAGEGK